MNFEWIAELSEGLLQSLKDTGFLLICITVISVCGVESIKRISKNVFKKELHIMVKFISNIIFTGLFSFFILLIFNGKATLILDFLYFTLLWCTSWIASVLAYDYVIKIVFNYLDKLQYDSKVKKLESELDALKYDYEVKELKKAMKNKDK
jgi:hypothetical protein